MNINYNLCITNLLRIRFYTLKFTLEIWNFFQISSDFDFFPDNSFSTVTSENIKLCVNDLVLKYHWDLNAIELYSEIEYFKYQTPLNSFQNATQLSLLKTIRIGILHRFISEFRRRDAGLRIFLTLTVTTATCKRSFSKH